MPIEDGLVALLSADSGVSALVGNRIHPLVLPRKPTYPALVYQRISGERVRSLSGPSGRARPRIQIDAYAQTYAAAKAVAKAVEDALDGYAGPAGTDRIDAASLEGDRDLHEDELRKPIFRVTADYFISYRET